MTTKLLHYRISGPPELVEAEAACLREARTIVQESRLSRSRTSSYEVTKYLTAAVTLPVETITRDGDENRRLVEEREVPCSTVISIPHRPA